MIQAAVPLLPAGCANWAYALAVLALFNVVYIGLVTMAQRDLKMMVSYSSVAHMGLCFLGIASMSVLGVGGAVLLMFGHGLSVALLFMLSNAVVNRTGEWNMLKMGGLYRQTPVLAGFFILQSQLISASDMVSKRKAKKSANYFGDDNYPRFCLYHYSPRDCHNADHHNAENCNSNDC